MARFTINGRSVNVNVSPGTPLLWVIREQVGLTGTKYGCGIAQCGACTVHLDGVAVRSCVLPVAAAEGKKVTTIEALASPAGSLHPVQQAFHDCHGLQCGFCTPGMVLATIDLLQDNPDPTELEIREALSGNICRCTGYAGIVDAVQQAALSMREGEGG